MTGHPFGLEFELMAQPAFRFDIGSLIKGLGKSGSRFAM
jgi:hypothetical protein